MLRQRFGLLSVAAMIIATAAGTILMVWYRGGGFSGAQGFPFAWYSQTDMIIVGYTKHGIHWLALMADIVFWVAVIICFGLLVERISQRMFNKP